MPAILNKKTDWSLRKALPDDRENISFFFKDNLWQAKNDLGLLYEWKYEKNPAGNTLALIGVNEEGKIIATSMFIPFNLSFNNKIIKSIQWVDLFVGFEYRGQALPSQSLQQGLEESRRSGVSICFAFPNDNSIPIHKKNNGIHLGVIQRYTKPLNAEYLVKRFIKSGLFTKIAALFANLFLRLASKETYYFNLSGFTFHKTENCGVEFDDLWNRASDTYKGKVITCKDSAYLNWKYASSPNKNRFIYSLKKSGKLCGFAVLESAKEIGYIIDLFAIDTASLNLLIVNSIKQFRKEGKQSVVFIALENNKYFKDLKKFGFVDRPEKKHFYIYLDENLANNEYFYDSKNWLITIGDCDIERL